MRIAKQALIGADVNEIKPLLRYPGNSSGCGD